VLTCAFEQEFLDVPQECLILTMKANQKYFPLLEGRQADQQVPRRQQHQARRPVGGDRRQRARGAPAPGRCQVLLRPGPQEVAGWTASPAWPRWSITTSSAPRASASSASPRWRAPSAQASAARQLANAADRAAVLAKADLLTDMVGEFPELQGIMGRYYALHDGEPADIADAIEDHYKPRFAGDELPRGDVGLCVALADKLQTLADMFGIGQLPDRRQGPLRPASPCAGHDPHADRARPAAGPAGLFGAAKLTDAKVIGQLSDFIYERLAGSLREQGYSALEVDAVVSLRPRAWATSPSGWPPCAPSPRCPKPPASPPPTSASATS
jgi:glycyl-tRNA synthetase beta chain